MTKKKLTVKIYQKDCKHSPSIIDIEEVIEITNVIANFLISKEPHNQLVLVLQSIHGFEVHEYEATPVKQDIADIFNKLKE